MKEVLGYVTFENVEINTGDKIKNDIIVYPTMQDSLRLCNMDSDKVVTMVSCCDYEQLDDSDYYGYYNMKLSHECTIKKIYSYEEVVNHMIDNIPNELEICKFLKAFPLLDKDKEKFSNTSNLLAGFIEVYQPKNKRMVKTNGKHNH